MKQSIRVLLVEDETIVLEAIRALLEKEETIIVIGEATSATTAIHKAGLLKPDVLLLDLRLPDQSGIEVIEKVVEEDPGVRILVFTASAEECEVSAAFQAGAVGYVLKTQAITDLVQAIQHAYLGQSMLHPTIASIMLNKLRLPEGQQGTASPLSPAERRTLAGVAQGLSNQEIAKRLGLSPMTVRAHIGGILRKLRLANRTQAALYALRHGLVLLDAPPLPSTPGTKDLPLALPMARRGNRENVRVLY